MDDINKLFYCIYLAFFVSKCAANDILGCGGFVKSHASIDFSKIEIGLYTKEGSLKEKTECAPTNGYYFLPLYEKGDYILKVHPPAGWSFEPSQVDLAVDGTSDQCSTGQDINFAFNGFGITGRVITAGQSQGPSGISVQLVSEKGESWNTVTTAGGDFHFTPVIPGKYTVKASHPRWQLSPAQATVQVREGNTVLAAGALAVRGYEVRGEVTLSEAGTPIPGLYVLLYSKEESPKLRVEGCHTALLQGVPDAPICHVVSDAAGHFTFGLVPAGEYRLVPLPRPPAGPPVTFNVKPQHVDFQVQHDSLFIKNAFEVTGWSVVGTVLRAAGGAGLEGARVALDGAAVARSDSAGRYTLQALRPAGGAGLEGARVALDGAAVARSDSAGRYTLQALRPGTYSISFQHELCEVEDVQLVVSAGGAVSLGAARAARWRVCGAVRAVSATAAVRVLAAHAPAAPASTAVTVQHRSDGSWCTFLAPGTYAAQVDVAEHERREGLQYYPLSQKISVGHGPVEGVTFSRLKAKLSGSVECLDKAICERLPVTLRALSPEGGYVGQPVVVYTDKGTYEFTDVVPGSVEVSVPAAALCWAEARHNVPVTSATARAPTFRHVGYLLSVRVSHPTQMEYQCEEDSGTLQLEAGENEACVRRAGRYRLAPQGCHRFQPAELHVHTATDTPQRVSFRAVSHAATVRVVAPSAVRDVTLAVSSDAGTARLGPLEPAPHADGGYVYEHTMYLEEGEVRTVSAASSTLLFSPAAPQQVVGGSDCQPAALWLRARAALTVAGRLRPPVAGVTVTLTGEDVELSMVTGADGAYAFGPLDAHKRYAVRAERESYAFSAPDAEGVMTARRLAEVRVEVRGEGGAALAGALVSVAGGGASGGGGGEYRSTRAAGEGGALAFTSLAPGDYYVKPLMKEYRFSPPHSLVSVSEGETRSVTLQGTRVAWSARGELLALGGAGLKGAVVLAAPLSPAGVCVAEEATTDGAGAFRVRGLMPGCRYTLTLKETPDGETAGLRLVHAPPTLQVTEGKDVENVRLIAHAAYRATDGSVLVVAAEVDWYRTLRLRLAAEDAPTSPLLTTKLDHAGLQPHHNPGLMYVLPRLAADNKTYLLQLDSSLSRSTHTFEDQTVVFVSDGRYKHFHFHFEPKMRSLEQELRHTSLLALPLLALVAAAWHWRVWLARWLADHSAAPLALALQFWRPALAAMSGGRTGAGPGGAGTGTGGAGAGDLYPQSAPKRSNKKKQ